MMVWQQLWIINQSTRRAHFKVSITAELSKTDVTTELRNVKSFTRSKSSKAKFTPRKARKSRQIQHLEGMKLTQKATSGEQKLNILSYNPGLKTEFHISCSHLPKTILDFAKLCILPDFLPQPYNFLHGYIRHIRDISQLWHFVNYTQNQGLPFSWTKLVRNSLFGKY